jgi:ankyrin repeat protein
MILVVPLLAQDMFKAVADGDLQKLKQMVAKNPHLLKQKNRSGMSLLHQAAFRGVPEVAEFLLAKGLKVDAENPRGITPLMGAAYFGHQEMASLLLQHGADINKKDERGTSPLLFALNRDNQKMVVFLLDQGASLGVCDNLGSSPLLLAALNGNREMVDLLLARGAEVNAANKRGGTPVSVAQREGHQQIVKLLVARGANRDGSGLPRLRGEYLGQKKPGATPQLFAANFISTERNQLNAWFMPDLKEFYFCVRMGRRTKIMVTRRINNIWTAPKPVSFTSPYNEIDLSLSPDGKQMFFCSTRPLKPGGKARRDNDFWVSLRQGKRWIDPVHLGQEINSDSQDYYPTVTSEGVLYFSSQREGQGTNNIYRSTLRGGNYGKAVKLGPEINTKYREFDPFIAPDESFLIFASERPGGLGGSDLHVSFRKKNGTWSRALNMGKGINCSGSDYTPVVTPDGQFLFFTSSRGGVDDLYWVSAQIIDRLKKEIINVK